jgi:hypothetical protein
MEHIIIVYITNKIILVAFLKRHFKMYYDFHNRIILKKIKHKVIVTKR